MWLGANNRSLVAPQPLIFNADFSATENPISAGGKWTNGKTDGVVWNDFRTSGGLAFAAGFSSDGPNPPGHFDDAWAIVKASAFVATPNQKAAITIHRVGGYSPPGSHEQGVFVRSTPGANSHVAYEAYWNHAGNHAIVLWNGALDSFTPLSSAGIASPADGDVFSLEIVGNVLISRVNGVQQLTATDNTIATGQFGMQAYVMSTSTATSYCPSAFVGTNL